MKKSLTATVLLSSLLLATTASADPYGSSGCGLGSILIGNKPGFTQVFAATTNDLSLTQSFAISSGTSNCDAGGVPAAGKAAKVFIEANREALAKDIARGSGETIETLAELAGCGDAVKVGASLQKSFKTIFPSSKVSSDQVSSSVITRLQSDAALACKSLG